MPDKNKKKHKQGYYLALAATLLAVIVVGLGAYTRLVHAGLGCPDWPGCYGFLIVPQSEQAIAIANSRFPDAPVEVDKGWAEMVHRYVAGVLMLLVLAHAIMAYRYRKQPQYPLILPFVLLGLICLQAAFGMWTVTLKLWPQVVTAHLLGGFATLGLLFLFTLRLSKLNWQPLAPTWRLERLRKMSAVGLVLVVLQIILGGWTSSNYAALACPDLPTCQGQWIPAVDFNKGFDITQTIGPNYLGGLMDSTARTAIHLSHRVGAMVVAIFLLMMLWAVRVYRRELVAEDRRGVTWLLYFVFAALVLQIVLGLSNVMWSLPLAIAVAHNLGGALLLLSMIALNYRLSSFVGRDI